MEEIKSCFLKCPRQPREAHVMFLLGQSWRTLDRWLRNHCEEEGTYLHHTPGNVSKK